GRGRRSGGSGVFGSSNPQDPRRSRAVPGRLPPSQAAIQLGSREAEAARGVQQAPMIERPSLEEAARSWLRKNEDLSPAEEVLKQALTEFVEKRFRGAAEELRRVHAIRHRLLDDPRPLRTLANLPYRDGDDETLALAASSSAPTDQGRLLFHLVRAFQPEKVLELGTNLGVSAAYIALGLRFAGKGRLTTI